jgi:hypothetical protein
LIIEQTFFALPPVMRQNILENARAFSKDGMLAGFFYRTFEAGPPLAEANKNELLLKMHLT